VDPTRVEMGWIIDFCAQSLRNIVIGLGGRRDGFAMQSKVEIHIPCGPQGGGSKLGESLDSGLFPQRMKDVFRRHRQITEVGPNGIVDCIHNGRRRR
jgi:hypothetical protein